ncbi:hypothetical protein A3A95_02210 [Candidatus Nomurabacteria bacterium RIFCSPLOWO2_01_FULL_39_18]|uniref:Peptide deformylase n=1 Tax=Candidatus Nomurabacteria bacterium RIFCSPHIGHO2_01_FULL_40_24b TaxID=1801739 RepID=A0A1F6V981_9BACT|nr:MAG: hypothetical protein A2647_00505 [Candidatus Nomurabacteria bacterium RIFCSPHIGHO2_01_FULL_40_24b]OGI90676.1 MAG: hypothetical protein A3A95_02210 [Candidatus Nomurabacteria bacterium RIFCSPLOWO2_01_FULL_39_18]
MVSKQVGLAYFNIISFNQPVKEIIKEPKKILCQKCEPVTDFEEAKQIADELLIVIKSVSKWWNKWLGFAANQIGFSKRIIVLRKSKNEYNVLINPVLVEKRFPFPCVETCYSFNSKKYYMVKRYLLAKVKYQNLKGESQETILKGPSAIYQEIDHINGILVSEIGLRIW